MPQVNIGQTMTDTEEYIKKENEPVPAGPYTFRVVSVEVSTSKKQNPMLVWSLDIIENPNPDYNGKSVKHYAVLPGEGQTKVGFALKNLIDICKAVNKPYTGTSLTTEEYIGLTCKANVSIGDRGWNQIDSFV